VHVTKFKQGVYVGTGVQCISYLIITALHSLDTHEVVTKRAPRFNSSELCVLRTIPITSPIS
jgi:hypothetical protein